jgi:hypothetical protein
MLTSSSYNIYPFLNPVSVPGTIHSLHMKPFRSISNIGCKAIKQDMPEGFKNTIKLEGFTKVLQRFLEKGKKNILF